MKSLKDTIAHDVEIRKCRYCEYSKAYPDNYYYSLTSLLCKNIDSIHCDEGVSKDFHCNKWMRATGSDDDLK